MHLLDLELIDLNTIPNKNVAKEAYLFLDEGILCHLHLDVVSGDLTRYLSNVLQLLINGLGKDHDVIEVDVYERQAVEDFVHGFMVCRWGAHEQEQHDPEGVRTKTGYERRQLLEKLSHKELPIFGEKFH